MTKSQFRLQQVDKEKNLGGKLNPVSLYEQRKRNLYTRLKVLDAIGKDCVVTIESTKSE